MRHMPVSTVRRDVQPEHVGRAVRTLGQSKHLLAADMIKRPDEVEVDFSNMDLALAAGVSADLQPPSRVKHASAQPISPQTGDESCHQKKLAIGHFDDSMIPPRSHNSRRSQFWLDPLLDPALRAGYPASGH